MPDVLYLDLSARMLSEGVAQGRIPQSSAVLWDADEHLPFESSAFDLAICRYAWHDFEDQHAVGEEIARVLASKGVFLVVDMSLPHASEVAVAAYNELHTLKSSTQTRISSVASS